MIIVKVAVTAVLTPLLFISALFRYVGNHADKVEEYILDLLDDVWSK